MSTTSLLEQRLEVLHNSVHEALKGTLQHTSWVYENFDRRILDNIRPALFLMRGDRDYDRPSHLLEVNIAEVEAYEISLQHDFPGAFLLGMFSGKIDKTARSSYVTLDFDYDHSQVSVEVQLASQALTYPALEHWQLVPTLPPPFVIFGCQANYDDVQEWQWEYINAYESWMHDHQLFELQHRRALVQIGGWADFRQDGDEDTFIAQANTDHGDCGAIYLEYEDGKFNGYEQMC